VRLSSRLGYGDGFVKAVERVQQLEEVGVDVVWVAEAYGYDAATRLGYLAARTHRVQLGSGIFPIYTRTPALLAQTAAGLDEPGRRSSKAGMASPTTGPCSGRERSSKSVAWSGVETRSNTAAKPIACRCPQKKVPASASRSRC